MKALQETMRWFGPSDVVSLSDIRQTGATGVVTALHEIPNGEIWPTKAILERKQLIKEAGLSWSVVESIPVHEDIKLRRGNYKVYIENYIQSIINLAASGIEVICYNFMPVLDWTRTDLNYELPDGGSALRFELRKLAAFDRYILKRPAASEDYPAEILKLAEAYYQKLDLSGQEDLASTVLAGLPGAEEAYSLKDFQSALDAYCEINADQLRENLRLFLESIIPVAEAHRIKMAIHPDDPPFPILGLPRVVSTSNDIASILAHPKSDYNGITFCTGSFGVRKDNDLPGMVERFKDSIHFIHLRSTKADGEGNFYEANHLQGDVPMFEVMKRLMKINSARSATIPMRPDHGHRLLDDLGKQSNPGYSAIGRLKGLAELRGLMHAIGHQD
ncbi:MAG: mannonate dehydratase [Flavobacteriaceae bacterium]